LLDWTASIAVATYFAVSETKYSDHDAVVWALSPGCLNGICEEDQHHILLMGHDRVYPLVLQAFGAAADHESRPPLAVLGTEVDLRMLMQQAAFTIHPDPTPLEEMERPERFLMKLRIPHEHKPILQQQLQRIGIRRWSLFPDIANLARDIAETDLGFALRKQREGEGGA